MRREGHSGRENSICRSMVARDHTKCSGNLSLVLLKHKVGKKEGKKKGEMTRDEISQIGTGLTVTFVLYAKTRRFYFISETEES